MSVAEFNFDIAVSTLIAVILQYIINAGMVMRFLRINVPGLRYLCCFLLQI